MKGRSRTIYGTIENDIPALPLNEPNPKEQSVAEEVGSVIAPAFPFIPVGILLSAANSLAGDAKQNAPVLPVHNTELMKLRLNDIEERNLHHLIPSLIAILKNEDQIKQQHSKTEEDKFIQLLDDMFAVQNIKEFNKLSKETKNDIILVINEALATFSQKSRLNWYKNKIAENIMNNAQKSENDQRAGYQCKN